MEIRCSMELQGAVEVAQNLRAGLELCLPDGFLLLLVAEKLQRDPRLDDRPVTLTLTHLVPGTKQKGTRASEYSLRRRTAPTDELSHPPGQHPDASGGSATPIGHIKG